MRAITRGTEYNGGDQRLPACKCELEKASRRRHKHHRAWKCFLASCAVRCDVSCLVCVVAVGVLACACWRMERNFGGCARHKAQGTEGTAVSGWSPFFPWKSGRDGVFGDVLVTLWEALVMCWVYSHGDGYGGRPLVNVDEDGWTSGCIFLREGRRNPIISRKI
jgi:hypothetical protein